MEHIKYSTKLLGVLTLYKPDVRQVTNNIKKYIAHLDTLILWDNSPSDECVQNSLLPELTDYQDNILWKSTGENRYIAPAINGLTFPPIERLSSNRSVQAIYKCTLHTLMALTNGLLRNQFRSDLSSLTQAPSSPPPYLTLFMVPMNHSRSMPWIWICPIAYAKPVIQSCAILIAICHTQ